MAWVYGCLQSDIHPDILVENPVEFKVDGRPSVGVWPGTPPKKKRGVRRYELPAEIQAAAM